MGPSGALADGDFIWRLIEFWAIGEWASKQANEWAIIWSKNGRLSFKVQVGRSLHRIQLIIIFLFYFILFIYFFFLVGWLVGCLPASRTLSTSPFLALLRVLCGCNATQLVWEILRDAVVVVAAAADASSLVDLCVELFNSALLLFFYFTSSRWRRQQRRRRRLWSWALYEWMAAACIIHIFYFILFFLFSTLYCIVILSSNSYHNA